MELGPAEARLSGEAADHSELPPATGPSSVGQGGRPGLPTHKAAKANRGPAGLSSRACLGGLTFLRSVEARELLILRHFGRNLTLAKAKVTSSVFTYIHVLGSPGGEEMC